VSKQKAAIFITDILTCTQEGISFYAAFRLSLSKTRGFIFGIIQEDGVAWAGKSHRLAGQYGVFL